MSSKPKEYADQIKIGPNIYEKAQNEFIVHLKPRLKELVIKDFFDKKKEFVELYFKTTGRRTISVKEFNTFSKDAKWVGRAKSREEKIEKLMEELEIDDDVSLVTPIYFRADVKYPTDLTFDDHITILLNENTKKDDLQNLLQELGVEEVKGPRGNLGERFMVLRVLNAKTQNTYAIAQKLAESKFIKYAEVNWIQLHNGLFSAPNDPWFKNQWNLENSGQIVAAGSAGTVGCDINAMPAWGISKGSPLVVIAIIDSGCDMTHPDLIDNYVQPDRCYNALTFGATIQEDEFGHGTCMAGIAAARGGNGLGISGVSWRCRIMPIKAFKKIGTFDYSTELNVILSALDWAINHNVHIINFSCGFPQDNLVDAKLQDCHNNNIVVVASSGNSIDYRDMSIFYPASNANVIAVGATDNNDKKWYQSCSGSKLDVVAPGYRIWTTDIAGKPKGLNTNFAEFSLDGGDQLGDYYNSAGKTSSAAAHVSGLAGLLLSYNPTLTPVQIQLIIRETAKKLPLQNPQPVRNDEMGSGRIDAGSALKKVTCNFPFDPADVYIRDSLSDTGIEPYTGIQLCRSPDIIIRKTAVLNPQTAFADMTVEYENDKVEIGKDSKIYIRVHNKGSINSDIHARVYYAPLNTTCSPDLWKYIGQIDFYNVPARLGGQDGHAVSEPLLWKNVPDPGAVDHFCIIVSIEGLRDLHPDPTGINNASQYMDFIRNSNNICYRNVVFEDVLASTLFTVNFEMAGLDDAEDKFELRIERDGAAAYAKVDLKLPKHMFMDTRVLTDNIVECLSDIQNNLRTFQLGEGRSTIKRIVMRQAIRNIARLEVKIPSDARPGEVYRITVQQLFNDEVMGDIHIIGKVIDPNKSKFIAVRGNSFVHKVDCKSLTKTDNYQWIPFMSLEDARASGYDMALDCLNQPFTSKDVSFKLAQKVLNFINNVKLAEDLDQVLNETPGIDYFEGRHGKVDVKEVGCGLGIDIAREILETRDKAGRFEKLTEIEAITGLGIDKFINLVNLFKCQ